MCISHIILIVGFVDSAQACRMDMPRLNTPTSCQKRMCRPSTKVSRLFDELSVACSTFQYHAIHRVTFHCDRAFYYKSIKQRTVRLLKSINTAYILSIFEFFASFVALATFSDSCTK